MVSAVLVIFLRCGALAGHITLDVLKRFAGVIVAQTLTSSSSCRSEATNNQQPTLQRGHVYTHTDDPSLLLFADVLILFSTRSSSASALIQLVLRDLDPDFIEFHRPIQPISVAFDLPCVSHSSSKIATTSSGDLKLRSTAVSLRICYLSSTGFCNLDLDLLMAF
jgi:hypothetical protein